MSTRLRELLATRHTGPASGITSVCSAHPWVLRAAAEQAREDGELLLIEATSNQVNQFGGYTGMRPADFRRFVEEVLATAGLPLTRLTLGGDHLGPNPWRSQPVQQAMQHAVTLVSDYVAAGFTKIHLDASMPLAGDPPLLSDELVAERAVVLCRAAEAATPSSGEPPVYVIGTEVPVPGGATHALHGVEVTTATAAARTLAVHQAAFHAAGLHEAWKRVIALVVQPGVEFDHDSVVDYQPHRATALTRLLVQSASTRVFEAHSTDYQRPEAYRHLVRDGFSILKVGPALTFALREALFSLAAIERALLPPASQSRLQEVVDDVMLREPADWQAYYPGDAAEQHRLRVYSYSDRIRYYWHKPAVTAAVDLLVQNLSTSSIPETLLSQHLPVQYRAVRQGRLQPEALALILDAVREVLRVYAAACVSARP